MRTPLALLALVGFVLSTVFGFMPTTRAGVQCPTAPVQTVTVRDCCGRLVARAPRPGEKAFKQCRCTEKRQSTLKADLSPRNDALPPNAVALEIPPSPPYLNGEHLYARTEAHWSAPPAVRPPPGA